VRELQKSWLQAVSWLPQPVWTEAMQPSHSSVDISCWQMLPAQALPQVGPQMQVASAE
jgi:hypothetical protein